MARLTKRSKAALKKTYRKRTKKTYKKKTYKSSSKGYKTKSLRTMAKKISASHYLSYGVSNILQKPPSNALATILKGQGYNVWLDTYGGVNAATAGIQGVTTVCGIYTPYDIDTYLGGTLDKHMMRNCKLSITMTNQCNAPVFVDLYDVVSRKDLNADYNGQSPSEVWTNEGAGTETYYGNDPFSCQEFVETFKVLKITRINLTAGETAEHKCTYEANQVFKENHNNTIAGTKDQGAYAGLTHFVMMVTRGAAADADNTTVGSSITKVAYIVQKTYKRQQIIQTGNSQATSTVLSTAATKIMELDGDENTFITA